MTAAPATTRRAPIIMAPHDGETVHAFGSRIDFKLTGDDTGGAFVLGLATIPPGGGPPPHVQHDEDELFIIVEGRYSFLVEGAWREAEPGAVVFVPRGAPHTFRNVGDVPARHWVLNTPGGFEHFFRKAAAVFAAGGPPDFAALARIAAEHGSTFVAPAR